MRLTICVSICLLLAACGGGGNSADAVNSEAKYVPDFTTPEGATEALIRAVETGNISLLSLTLKDDERDKMLPVFEQRFAESRRLGVEWTIAQKESEWVPGSEARSLFSFTEMKDGKPTGNIVGAWYVFVKTEDGTWKYSDVASKRWVAYLREQEKQPPANSGD